MAAEMEDQLANEEDDPNEDEEGRARDAVDRSGDDQMFEQFLKSGDYAMGSPSAKRRRMYDENPEEDDFDDEEFAFKELIEG